MVLFNEKYVFDGIAQDGMFDVFSNSYLVVIGGEPDTNYVKYSNDRARGFELRTEIADTPTGKVVRKIPLNEDAKEHVQKMEHFYEILSKRYEGSGLRINPCHYDEESGYAEFPFEKGVTLEELLDKCLERDDLNEFYRLFDKYLELISYGEGTAASDYDLIFANVLVDGDDWTVIDYEWTVEKAVTTAETAFRAIYCYVLEEEKRNKINLDLILNKIGITNQQAEDYQEKEGSFQKQVTGKRRSMGEIRAAMGTYSVDPKMLMERHLQKILDQRMQVYFDRGNGFSEVDSTYIPDIYVDDTHAELTLSLDGNVRGLRIDPADRSCMVKITELLLNGVEVPMQKKYLETNGKTIKNGCYAFATQDPNILIRLSELPRQGENVLVAKFEVSPISSDMANDMATAVKKLI